MIGYKNRLREASDAAVGAITWCMTIERFSASSNSLAPDVQVGSGRRRRSRRAIQVRRADRERRDVRVSLE